MLIGSISGRELEFGRLLDADLRHLFISYRYYNYMGKNIWDGF